ncbi:MAG: ABC transporter ATP-binding protein [Christensenellaceae bacterium]|nr:ABC transporter ATP-binding protein [Christensenellaceae bacterium]
MGKALLKTNNLSVSFGGIHALRETNIEIMPGEIVAIIGSNGAGKSSMMNAISGVIKFSGEIEFKGSALPKKAHKIVSAGISHVPEGRLIFANLTTMENLRMGAYLRSDSRAVAETLARVLDMFPRLKERENQIAGTLSGGEQQMLAMGRGLMSDPELLLLDEPSLGLAPILVDTIFDIIRKIKQMGKTILLVEQNAYKALSVADRAYVLTQGRITLEGAASDIMCNPLVVDAYLGKKAQ